MELSIYDTLLLWIIIAVCIIAFILVKALEKQTKLVYTICVSTAEV